MKNTLNEINSATQYICQNQREESAEHILDLSKKMLELEYQQRNLMLRLDQDKYLTLKKLKNDLDRTLLENGYEPQPEGEV